MSLANSDFVLYTSASMPTDDSTTSGGAVNAQVRAELNELASSGTLIVASNNNADTKTVSIIGRVSTGEIITEVVTLTGTTPVTTTHTFIRILKATLGGTCAGAVTITNNSDSSLVAAIPAGELGFTVTFYGSASDPSVTETRYEKLFLKNTNGTLAALDVTIGLSATAGGTISFGLDPAVNNTSSVANRTAAPAGITFGTSTVPVPGDTLGPGDAIGIWVKQTLSAGLAGAIAEYDFALNGRSI